MKFYYIYKALAHPENNGYVQPFTLAERLLHVKEAEQRIGSEFVWLCDNMQNELKHALGNAPNSEFIIGPNGKLVVQRRWSNPGHLRNDLIRLVGAVENPTAASDIDVRFTPPRVTASGGGRPGSDSGSNAPNESPPAASQPDSGAAAEQPESKGLFNALFRAVGKGVAGTVGIPTGQ